MDADAFNDVAAVVVIPVVVTIIVSVMVAPASAVGW